MILHLTPEGLRSLLKGERAIFEELLGLAEDMRPWVEEIVSNIDRMLDRLEVQAAAS